MALDLPTPQPGAIYAAIQKIMQELEAIPKDRTNEKQGFKFRGIDDVYNALHPLLAKHGVFSTSTILNRVYAESTSKSGTAMIERVLSIRYRFYATDGSFVETEVDGEAIDSGDKASNKAMAVAHKYALIQMFCIPTADEKDTDAASPVRETVSTPRATSTKESCPDCAGWLDEKTSQSAKNPGRKYLSCPKCVDKQGKPGKFVRWSDEAKRPPPDDMEERQAEIAETSGAAPNRDMVAANAAIERAAAHLEKEFPRDPFSQGMVIQALFACSTLEKAKESIGAIEVARALKDHLLPAIRDVKAEGKKKDPTAAFEEGA